MLVKYLIYFNTSHYITFNFTPKIQVILSYHCLSDSLRERPLWEISIPPPPFLSQAQTQTSNVGTLTLMVQKEEASHSVWTFEEKTHQRAGQASSWNSCWAPSPAGREGLGESHTRGWTFNSQETRSTNGNQSLPQNQSCQRSASFWSLSGGVRESFS